MAEERERESRVSNINLKLFKLYSSTTWFDLISVRNRTKRSRIINKAEKITGKPQRQKTKQIFRELLYFVNLINFSLRSDINDICLFLFNRLFCFKYFLPNENFQFSVIRRHYHCTPVPWTLSQSSFTGVYKFWTWIINVSIYP